MSMVRIPVVLNGHVDCKYTNYIFKKCPFEGSYRILIGMGTISVTVSGREIPR